MGPSRDQQTAKNVWKVKNTLLKDICLVNWTNSAHTHLKASNALQFGSCHVDHKTQKQILSQIPRNRRFIGKAAKNK